MTIDEFKDFIAQAQRTAGGLEGPLLARNQQLREQIAALESSRNELAAQYAGMERITSYAAQFLETLHDNMVSNDLDMKLDECRAPAIVAAELRAAIKLLPSRTRAMAEVVENAKRLIESRWDYRRSPGVRALELLEKSEHELDIAVKVLLALEDQNV